MILPSRAGLPLRPRIRVSYSISTPSLRGYAGKAGLVPSISSSSPIILRAANPRPRCLQVSRAHFPSVTLGKRGSVLGMWPASLIIVSSLLASVALARPLGIARVSGCYASEPPSESCLQPCLCHLREAPRLAPVPTQGSRGSCRFAAIQGHHPSGPRAVAPLQSVQRGGCSYMHCGVP
ncbi:hypothetical protein LCGC14_2937920 [marine sediment metagenome]|uniref:Uncharacterized protein n=1 Tax=marine sediment metagenome TaxID=412755 RepID=A0A0F8ZRP3_9ZZZZ